MHWRVRASLDDRPGALAALAGYCGDEEVNILGLQIFPCEQEVIDELILHTPDGWTASDVEQLMLLAGARHPMVEPCTAHALEDTAVRYLRAAQVVSTDPPTLEQQLRHLLGAASAQAVSGGEQLLLHEGDAPPVRLVRGVPFTATERARAAALRQIAGVPTLPHAAASKRPPVDATILLRSGSAHDASMLVAMHARCSAATIQRRYHTAMPYLSPRLAHALLAPDDGWSLVLTCGSDLVGIASFARDHDGEYEVGLLVEDHWQRRGLGTRLLRALGEQAAHQGISRLTCIIQPGNHAVLTTIRRAGFNPRVTTDDGLLHARIPLTRLANRSEVRTNKADRGQITSRLVPLLHARQELRDVNPVADIIDNAVRGGA